MQSVAGKLALFSLGISVLGQVARVPGDEELIPLAD